MTPTAAVLGAGAMGGGMVKGLAREGLSVSVWNRMPDRAQALAAFGARPAASVADAVRGTECISTMLDDAEAVLQVPDDILVESTSATVWLQCSMIGLDGPAQLAGRVGGRLRLVDAPVLGTKQPAENGALVVLTSGPRAAVDSVSVVLAAIGSRIQHVDDVVGHACQVTGIPADLVDATQSVCARSITLNHGADDIAAMRTALATADRRRRAAKSDDGQPAVKWSCNTWIVPVGGSVIPASAASGPVFSCGHSWNCSGVSQTSLISMPSAVALTQWNITCRAMESDLSGATSRPRSARHTGSVPWAGHVGGHPARSRSWR